ncbi:GIY-YIG nuclease family protein [Shewanella intestini]|uniref:GIY-YIG nuclease family protein n=1 Tax=Shewanella intestini TaxID=2017544 RepID=A0ABS5I5N8_9GAMM|nr:GIY-YIG nuclease family protein [Shewanella sp. XMDDZSB0408]MBR9729339.1 GIY-YIG nuclease family protein [Shewanella intestini]MRG37418.1 GIY-YIG nuclease family protein [Shewanella sp. XMDDZSB0408]
MTQNSHADAWFVYMIKCANGHLYTGITTDVARRFNEHQLGGKKGAKYLKGKGPLTLVYKERQHDRSVATKRELAIKKMTREQKLGMIDSSKNLYIPALNVPKN